MHIVTRTRPIAVPRPQRQAPSRRHLSLLRPIAALLVALVCFASGVAGAEPADPETIREIAPGGRLRAAINYGNIVLANRSLSFV